MPSFFSLLLRSQIALLNPLLQAMDLEKSRRLQDTLGRLGARALETSVSFREERFALFDGAWAVPLKGRARQAVLYLHGGAYTAGTLDYAKGFGGLLAQGTGRAVFCAAYRLAPEHPFPAALDDALEAWRFVLGRYAPGDVAFAGESAGGGLCYGLALRARAEGLPLPGRIVTVSPWADLSMSGDYLDLEEKDLLLSRKGLLENARLYAGGRPLSDPYLSPVFGDLRGLPPSLIFAGTREILLRDAERMHDRLLAAGCASELVTEEGMWHAYALYGVPEGKAALRKAGQWLKGG